MVKRFSRVAVVTSLAVLLAALVASSADAGGRCKVGGNARHHICMCVGTNGRYVNVPMSFCR